jgi:AAA15 family ATPase/GTPase
MEKLEIKNFAGLKDVSIDVKPITGLIGPQASGKSVTAKLLYYFRTMLSYTQQAPVAGMQSEQFKHYWQSRFRDFFPPYQGGNSVFEIRYSAGKEDKLLIFTIRQVQGSVSLELPHSISSMLDKYTPLIREEKPLPLIASPSDVSNLVFIELWRKTSVITVPRRFQWVCSI